MVPPALASLSPEARLVLLSAGGSAHDPEMRVLLAGGLDWGKVLVLAQRERALAILWARVNRLGHALIPDETAVQLQRMALVSEFTLLQLEQRLGEVLSTLDGAGISVVLLKGAALAVSVYAAFSQRPMADIDLLLEPARALDAQRLLVARGWAWDADEALQTFYDGHHHLPPMYRAKGSGAGACLELHTALFFEGHPFLLSGDDIRERAHPVHVGRGMALVPAPVHQLLHLCLHFAWSHGMTAGAWRTFRDMQALIATDQIVWRELVEMARATRGGSCCYWSFRLARDLLGVAVPEDVLQALRPPQPEYVLRRVEQHFLYHLLPTEGLCPSVRVARRMWTAGICPEWSGHGAVRPWDRSPIFPNPARAATGVRKVVQHVANARGWARYIRAIVRPAPLSS